MTTPAGLAKIADYADGIGADLRMLVGPGEEDYDNNKILLTSPIGQALVGKTIGEEVEVPVPRGKLRYKVVAINAD